MSTGESAINFPSRSWTGATYPAVRTLLVLVQRSQAQGADVAGDVVAGGDRVVADGIGADEAHLGIVVGSLILCLVFALEVLYPAGRCRLGRFVVCGFGGCVGCVGRAGVMCPSSAPPPAAAPSAPSSASTSVAVAAGSRGSVICSSTAAGCWCGRTTSRSHAGL